MDSTDNAGETRTEHEQTRRHGDEGLEELQAEAPDQEVAGHGTEAMPRPPLPKGPVLVVAAHPDDPEFGCGGTMAALLAAGRQVVVAVVTDGTEGGEDPSVPDHELRDLREGEQRAASAALGNIELEFMRFPDGRLQPTLELRRAIATLIRRYRPATIFTHDPTSFIGAGYINHPDHRATGQATLDAIFPAAGNPRSFRELLAEGLQPHKINSIYLFYTPGADAWIDISEVIERKVASLRCHRSQIGKPEELDQRVREWAQKTGETAKLPAAEGFRHIVLRPDEEEPKQQEEQAE